MVGQGVSSQEMTGKSIGAKVSEEREKRERFTQEQDSSQQGGSLECPYLPGCCYAKVLRFSFPYHLLFLYGKKKTWLRNWYEVWPLTWLGQGWVNVQRGAEEATRWSPSEQPDLSSEGLWDHQRLRGACIIHFFIPCTRFFPNCQKGKSVHHLTPATNQLQNAEWMSSREVVKGHCLGDEGCSMCVLQTLIQPIT